MARRAFLDGTGFERPESREETECHGLAGVERARAVGDLDAVERKIAIVVTGQSGV